MPVTFNKDLATLVSDIEAVGFCVVRTLKFPAVPARRAEVHLVNGARVIWDRLNESLWVEGPDDVVETVQQRLWATYEGAPIKRLWALHAKLVGTITLMTLLFLGGLALMASGWTAGGQAATLTASAQPLGGASLSATDQ